MLSSQLKFVSSENNQTFLYEIIVTSDYPMIVSGLLTFKD